MAKKPIGRPAKGDEKLLQKSIRMTRDEWEKVAKTAEALYMSQSMLIGLCLSEFLNQAAANEIERRRTALNGLARNVGGTAE